MSEPNETDFEAHWVSCDQCDTVFDLDEEGQHGGDIKPALCGACLEKARLLP